MPLTDAKIKNAKPQTKPFKLSDGRGLCVEIRPHGAKLWRYRYRIAGKENVFAIGPYPEVKLAQAREELRQAKELVKQGIHPTHHRKAERLRKAAESTNTFEAVAREWMCKHQKKWSPYYWR